MTKVESVNQTKRRLYSLALDGGNDVKEIAQLQLFIRGIHESLEKTEEQTFSLSQIQVTPRMYPENCHDKTTPDSDALVTKELSNTVPTETT